MPAAATPGTGRSRVRVLIVEDSPMTRSCACASSAGPGSTRGTAASTGRRPSRRRSTKRLGRRPLRLHHAELQRVRGPGHPQAPRLRHAVHLCLGDDRRGDRGRRDARGRAGLRREDQPQAPRPCRRPRAPGRRDPPRAFQGRGRASGGGTALPRSARDGSGRDRRHRRGPTVSRSSTAPPRRCSAWSEKALGRSINGLVPGLFTNAPGTDLRDLYRLSGMSARSRSGARSPAAGATARRSPPRRRYRSWWRMAAWSTSWSSAT